MYLCSWRLCLCLHVWINWWFFLFVGYSRWMLSTFLCRLFLRFEHGWFCVVFVGLISVEDFVGSCCLWLLFVLTPTLFFFSSGANGREYILEMWHLKAAILCSMGWFGRKLIVVSVVVGLRYMSVLRFVCLCVIVKSRTFIHMFSYVGLSFMLSCIWFMCAVMACGWVLVSYMIRMSSTYCVYSSMFFVSRSCFMCVS